MASTPNIPNAGQVGDNAPLSGRQAEERARYVENRRRMAASLEQFLDRNAELLARLAK
jgi:hypothetical protein